MGAAISQVLASLEPSFYTVSIVRMALRRFTEKHSSGDEIVILILLQGYQFYPTDPRGAGVTSIHNKRGCAILISKVVPENPGTYLKLRPKNPGT